ncbi:hypothetical protein H8K52_20635 [Undibacterium seohonense]|jgi:hypothetical protein|uniref:Uncharacterized protein n=1 Tax=Undibacterium seohonense TaxID=1344950 RepID=A0ABR6XBT3_9BURK|nr:Imm26 family immunity protein [Undibacterium seohonense]MBC3809744.1 hypothetical protein [Undibacterium seohonense]
MVARQRRTIGSIVIIPIDDFFIHAQVLPEVDMVFFNTKGKTNLTPDEIVNTQVLFREAVNDDAIRDGRWLKAGKASISKENSQPLPKFIQDALNPTKFEIYVGGVIRSAKREECLNLQRCAVWAVNHIEDRIRDYYNGMPNKWVEQMRIK